jgi:transcriptional antiterminator RfaH
MRGCVHLIHSHPHAEVKASEHLRRQGFETYLPRYLKQRRHARRIEKVSAPLFPSYLFAAVDMTSQRWLAIDSTIGVKRLVRYGNHPAAVSISILETLKRREDANGFIQLGYRPKFSRGDKVCVLDGAFQDCFGLYEGMSGGDRVAILLDLLGRKVRVVLNSELIRSRLTRSISFSINHSNSSRRRRACRHIRACALGEGFKQDSSRIAVI